MFLTKGTYQICARSQKTLPDAAGVKKIHQNRFLEQVNSELGISIYKGGDPAAGSPTATLLRLHPNHQPYRRRLPLLPVSSPTSGKTNFRGVTGGVYKARERIHPGMLIQNY